MEWLNNRLGQIIAGVTVAGTLAGFGYEGAKVINQIENLESSIGRVEANYDGFTGSVETAASNTSNLLSDLDASHPLQELRLLVSVQSYQ